MGFSQVLQEVLYVESTIEKQGQGMLTEELTKEMMQPQKCSGGSGPPHRQEYVLSCLQVEGLKCLNEFGIKRQNKVPPQIED